MKKKIIIIIAVVIIAAAIVFGAGRNKENKTPDNKVSTTEIVESTTKKSNKVEKTTEKVTEKETEIEKKDPDKIVSFEIPVIFLDSKYQNNLKALVRDKGYESAVYTRNKQCVKVKLKALSYDLYLMRTGIYTMSAICETIESKEFPYVKNLGEYEDDFSFVTVLVDSAKFMSADNKEDLYRHISDCCAYYLLQDNDSPKEYVIEICDEKTKMKIESRKYNKNDYLK